MEDPLARAEQRQRVANGILRELELPERWGQFGTCRLVGSVAYHLVVAPDIDIEVWCEEPRIQDGFEVLRACADHPNVTKARFWNALGPPHHGLYWQLRYVHRDEEWKIDTWSIADSYDGPCGTRMVAPMHAALDDESRRAILRLKEAVHHDQALAIPSIQIYRAVLDDGVDTLADLLAWLSENELEGVVTDWMPPERGGR